MMKNLLITLCFFFSVHTQAQYYYKDIISTQRTAEQLKTYRDNRISNVSIVSYESTGEKTEDFEGAQVISKDYLTMRTNFKTALAGESELTTFFNQKGQVIKTIDTTDGSGSVSTYQYDQNGRLSVIINVSTSPGMHVEKEAHQWQYDDQGRPAKMLRIKNDFDTTYVTFIPGERGNVAEENSTRKGQAQTGYYYYYNDNDQLTDIVTYNERAKRLLPVYIFEYNDRGLPASMMVVPEGSDDYQRWYYEYNTNGLKIKETCFNKRKQVLGRIEYRYDK